jgi:hypothetical protein
MEETVDTCTCPQCHGTMLPDSVPDERAIVKAKVGSGSNVAYATNFAAAVTEKQKSLGKAFVCTLCRYVLRKVVEGAAAGLGA